MIERIRTAFNRRNIRSEQERGEYVTGLDRAVRSGEISWEACQQAQSQAMPTCDCCKQEPSVCQDKGVYICLTCVVKQGRFT